MSMKTFCMVTIYLCGNLINAKELKTQTSYITNKNQGKRKANRCLIKLLFFLFVPNFFSETIFSQTRKDSLFFNNGSVVIGEMKRIKLGVITFDPDDANDITVQVRKIKAISAVSKVFRIESTKHTVYFGELLPYRKDNFALLVQGVDTTVLFLQDISVLYAFENNFMQRFSGNVGFGYSYTRSSDFGRMNFDGKLSYLSKKEEVSLTTSGIYTITDSIFSRDREDIAIKNNFYFSPTWFSTAFLSYQRNIELGLQRRYQEGIGMGNKFLTTKNLYAWARSGLVFNQEKSTEGETSNTLTEIFGQLQFNLFRFQKPEINLEMSQSFFYSLSQSGRFRNDGGTNLNWEIIDDLKLKLEFYNNYDSRPPVEGNRKLDYGIVFGINYSF